MSSFSSLGIRLCILFGILLVLAFVAEVCYLLWWKKKTEDNQDIENQNCSPSKKSPLYFSCFKTTTSSRNILNQPKNLQNCLNESDDINEKEQEPSSKDMHVKYLDEESLDIEIMRLHNLCGPPRFLTTINEETKEDMEVDSVKGSRTMSLCDVSSPLKSTQYLNMEGFLNPLYDFEAHEFDLSKLRSSPPPTFKFMRDAEEKLLRTAHTPPPSYAALTICYFLTYLVLSLRLCNEVGEVLVLFFYCISWTRYSVCAK